jgi:hypothetical protein
MGTHNFTTGKGLVTVTKKLLTARNIELFRDVHMAFAAAPCRVCLFATGLKKGEDRGHALSRLPQP